LDVVHVLPGAAQTICSTALGREDCADKSSQEGVKQSALTFDSSSEGEVTAACDLTMAKELKAHDCRSLADEESHCANAPPWLARRTARHSNRQPVREKQSHSSAAVVTQLPGATEVVSASNTVTCRGADRPAATSWEEVVSGCWCNQLQKDFANLEAAIAKWLAHEEIGVLTRAKLLAKIRTSAAMRRLAEREGECFQQEAFTAMALRHALIERGRRQCRAAGA